jgi:glycosyltransferase involved in cell wall biosynthesis
MILIVSAVFPPEPVVSANLSFDIASELALKNQVVVISPKPTRPFNTKYENVVPIQYPFRHIIMKTYTCPKSNIIGRMLESYSLGKATRKYLLSEKGNIDLIYANTWPVFAQLILIKTAKKLNIPVIIHIHDIYPESLIKKIPIYFGQLLQLIFLPIDKFILQNSKTVITISPQMKNYLQASRELNENNISVVRNWQNDENFINYKLPENIKPNIFTFMFLGSISPSAGVELLIRSFAKTNIPNSKLIIAGNGSDKSKCMDLADKFPYSKIEFCEAPSHIVPELQSKADVLLLPLRKGIGKTASPSKLSAYMFSAKPIIGCIEEDSDAAGIINSSECGWIVPPEDIESLTNIMEKVAKLDNKELQIKGKNGFNYALEHLSRKNNLQRMIAIINENVSA